MKKLMFLHHTNRSDFASLAGRGLAMLDLFRWLFLLMIFLLACKHANAQNQRFIGVGDGVYLFHTDNSRSEKLYSFSSTDHAPLGDLFRDSNGTLWGTTKDSDEAGAIFKVNPDGTSISYVHFFRQLDGEEPRSTLMEANGKLWGTTYRGGTNDDGIIFSLELDGTGFNKHHDFEDNTGIFPGDHLALSNDRLWGMTTEGGSEGGGVIFSIDINGADYQVEHHFYDNGDGGYPEGGLIAVGNTLWGMTNSGGAEDYGVVFSISNDGTNYQLRHSFEYTSSDGAYPFGDLLFHDGRLWGVTSEGGDSDDGTLFSLLPDGSDYQVHYLFDNASGGQPQGTLVASGGNLWGTTSWKNGLDGTVFSFDPDGTSIVTPHSFNGTNGAEPIGSLVDAGGILWGLTSTGGSIDQGTIFHIDNTGSNFTSAYSFGLWGEDAVGDLLEYDDKIWGITDTGGANETGTIYTLNRSGGEYTVVYSFGVFGSAPQGTSPRGGLIEKDGMLYGITNLGGANSVGTFFRLDPADNSVTKLHDFATGGFPYPRSGLFEFQDAFYGMLGGSDIFKIDPDGANFEIVQSLPGIQSDISLLDTQGKLWGTERSQGQVFSYDIGLDAYALMKDFTTAFSTFDEPPRLIESGSSIYSVTHSDGAASAGTIYTMQLDGSGFTTLHEFDGAGSFPVGMLTDIGGTLYGITRNGGDHDKGVFYSIGMDGSNFTVLRHFNGIDQSSPNLGNFIHPRYSPVFLKQIPDMNLQEEFGSFDIVFEDYLYDVEDGFMALNVNWTQSSNPKSSIGNQFIATPTPTLRLGSIENHFGSSTFTIDGVDSDGNTFSTSFTLNVAPVADGLGIINQTIYGSYPNITDDAAQLFGLDVDLDNSEVSSVTHFRVTDVTGGTVLLNDETTEVADGEFVSITLGSLKFLSDAAGSASFKVQAAVGPNAADLGGDIKTIEVVTSGAAQLTWANPANIIYGNPLTPNMLNPSANMPGTFSFTAYKGTGPLINVNVGSILAGGTYTLYAVFSPDDSEYQQSSIDVPLVVDKAMLTVTAEDKTVVYGESANFTASYSGFVNGEGIAQLTGTHTVASDGQGNDVGTYDITFTNFPASNNYAFTGVEGTMTVTPAPLTISLTSSVTRQYGDANPDVLNFAFTGLTNSDIGTDLDTPPVASALATVSSAVGTYPITISGASDPNYAISYTSGELVITRRTIGANAVAATKVYGAANPILSVDYVGLISGDVAGDIDVPFLATTAATAASDVGSYAISLQGGSDNNYQFTLGSGSLTVTKADLNISPDNLQINYGQAPAVTLTYTGLVNDDGPEDINVAPVYATSITNTTLPGAYSDAITLQTSGSDNNYNLVAGTTADIMVNKAPLRIIADNLLTTYGGPIPVLTFGYQGFVNGQSVTSISAPTITTTASQGAGAGSYPITFSGGSSELYQLQFESGFLTIDKAKLDLMPNDAETIYGTEPVITFSYSGFINQEGPEVIDVTPTFALTVNLTSVPGTYVDAVSGLKSGTDNNYSFNVVGSSDIVVRKAPLKVTAENKSMAFGQPFPTLTAKYEGFVNGQNQSSITLPGLTTNATNNSSVGSYVISVSGGSSNLYELELVNGTLTITKAQATITITNLLHIFDGTEKSATVTTAPAGLNTVLTYNGAAQKPVAGGSYNVLAVINETNYSGQATAVLVIDPVTGLNEPSANISVTAYPNPATDYIAVSGISEAKALRVYNPQGQMVAERQGYHADESIDVSHLAAGVYLVLIEHNRGITSRRVAKN